MSKPERRLRAAVIGHTGRGNYGHGLDIVFEGLPMVEVVAVADPVAAGRQQAQTRTGATRAYADYRELLAKEQPDLVAIGPRWVGERVEMVEAAAAAGAHLYVEKPLAADLAAADRILAACERAGVKIAVAHQSRLHSATRHALRLVQEGAIGRLRLIRGYGKMDRRGGGQDLMVLGTHILDLMRLYAGDAAWASADLVSGAALVQEADVRAGDEEIGPIAGDGLRATYGFHSGVIGQFESFGGLGLKETPYGLDLVGEEGQLCLRGGFTKQLLRYPYPYLLPGAEGARWEPVTVPDAVPGELAGTDGTPQTNVTHLMNQRAVRDLLAAVAEDREPLASGQNARAALELIQAVAAAHAAGGRISLPLVERRHPYQQS